MQAGKLQNVPLSERFGANGVSSLLSLHKWVSGLEFVKPSLSTTFLVKTSMSVLLNQKFADQ